MSISLSIRTCPRVTTMSRWPYKATRPPPTRHLPTRTFSKRFQRIHVDEVVYKIRFLFFHLFLFVLFCFYFLSYFVYVIFGGRFFLTPQSELRIGISKAILLFSWQCFTSMCRISYLLSFLLCPDFFFDSVPLITEVPQRFVLSPNVSVLYVWPWLTIFNNVHLFLLIRELLYFSTYSLWFQHYICAVHNFSYYQSFFSPALLTVL